MLDNKQDELRKKIKMLPIITDNDFTLRDVAGFINIDINSLYNYINKQYNLKQANYNKLNDFINEILSNY